MRILLVENCAATAEQVSGALTSLGHETDVACSMETTAELIARIPYDAFILDLNVGGVSTLEVGEQLRIAGHLVCFASGVDQQSVAGYTSDALFLSKPYTLDGVADMLARLSPLAHRTLAFH